MQIFDELYTEKRMKCVNIFDLHDPTNRFKYCRGIYEKIVDMNKHYVSVCNEPDPSEFWPEMGRDASKINSLMEKYKYLPIFTFSEPREIVETIESMSNTHLWELIGWVWSRKEDCGKCQKAIGKEEENAKEIADILEVNNSSEFGVRAGHIKHIVRLLRGE
jgi:hypothetical protein